MTDPASALTFGTYRLTAQQAPAIVGMALAHGVCRIDTAQLRA